MVFDRAAGQLSQVVVGAGEPGGPVVPGERTLGYLGQVLGHRVAAAVRQAPHTAVPLVTPGPHPGGIEVLSRLARLGSAWRTTPVPCSPLWAAETAGLTDRCQRRVAPGTAPLSSVPLSSVPRPAARSAAVPGSENLGGWLEPALVPPGVFRYGLSPDCDLDIRVHDDDSLITVDAMLAAGAARCLLASCRVRLVDSGARRVLAVSRFRLDGLSAHAELSAPSRTCCLWIEVVADERRPVRGTRLRRMRRALRWADAALRAASRPAGLDPGRTDEQWAGLAALAWERCRADWTAAGDDSQAAEAARLSQLPVQWTRPYLAEAACEPAVIG